MKQQGLWRDGQIIIMDWEFQNVAHFLTVWISEYLAISGLRQALGLVLRVCFAYSVFCCLAEYSPVTSDRSATSSTET